jgi:predicted RNase H-like HicB family nuclease
MMNKTAKDYLNEPYSRILIPADGAYSARVLEFHGCYAQGGTPEEAYKNLEKAAEAWIEVALSMGHGIPSPLASHDFSGRIALRVPRSIHKQAAKFAEMDDTSLNQFFLTAISARVGAEEFYERLCNKLEDRCMRLAGAVPSYTIYVHQWSSPSQSPIPWPLEQQIITLSGPIIKKEALDG